MNRMSGSSTGRAVSRHLYVIVHKDKQSFYPKLVMDAGPPDGPLICLFLFFVVVTNENSEDGSGYVMCMGSREMKWRTERLTHRKVRGLGEGEDYWDLLHGPSLWLED